MIVIHQDARALKYCNRGQREFFLKNNLDWSDYLKNGIDDSKLSQFDNVMINRVIEQAKKRLKL